MKRKLSSLIIALMLALSAMCGCNHSHSNYSSSHLVLRLANNFAASHPTSQACEKFAELVYEYTNGEIKVLCYHDSKLGDEISSIEQLEIGGIDFARVSTASLVEITPEFDMFSIPYIYENDTHMWNVLNGSIGKYMLTNPKLLNRNISGLCWYTAGSRCFYSTEPLNDGMKSLQGLKIRTLDSKLFRDTIKALDAEPAAIPFENVYTALLAGDIEGAENNLPSYISSDHYKAAPYFMLDEHFRIPEMVIASEITMKSLTQEQRNAIRKAALESTDFQIELWKDYEQQAIEEAAERGCIITELTDEQKAEFKAAVKNIRDEYADKFGDNIHKIEQTPTELP